MIKTYIYKKADNINLKIKAYIPDGTMPGDGFPSILFFYGGGWRKASLDQFKNHSIYFCEKGYACFCVEYRVRNLHGATPFDCIEDARDAVKYVYDNKTKLKVDGQKIALCGGSAGGHLAAIVSILHDEQKICDIPSTLVLFNPVIDTSDSGYGNELLGSDGEKISPLHMMDRKIVPTIIFHGESDDVVPYEKVCDFAHKAKKYGSICKLHIYEGQGHGFYLPHIAKTDKYYLQTLHEMERFLNNYKNK